MIRAHDSAVSALTMSSKNHLIASSSWDATVNLWKNFHCHRDNPPKVQNNLVGTFDHDSEVSCIDFNQ